MDGKFQNKYRNTSTRLQYWDYGWNAPYFVTICTKNREHYFGKIVNGEMNLSEIGGIAESEWLKTPDIRPDMNLELGAFVVMPNHFHCIVIIGNNKYNHRDGNGIGGVVDGRGAMHCAPTDTDMDTNTKTKIKNKFGPQRKNLASIIRGYKTGVKKYATMNNIDFKWQPLYNDHIIRDKQSFDRIRNYINANIKNWGKDDFYQK